MAKLDLSSYKLPPSPEHSLSTGSAALSNATKLNLEMYKNKRTETPIDNRGTIEKTLESPNDLQMGMAKGALSTLKGLGTIGKKIGGVLNKGANALGYKGDLFQSSDIYDPNTEAGKRSDELLTPSSKKEAIGKNIEQAAEFFIPAGEVGKLEKILAGGAKTATVDALTKAGVDPTIASRISKAVSTGTKMLVRAGEGGAVVAAQSGGDKNQTKTAAEVSGIIPGASEALKLGTDLAGGALKRVGGAASGRGTAVIDEILKDPKAALEGLTGKSMDSLSKDSRTLKDAVVGMKEAAQKEHARVISNLEEIYQNEGKSFSKDEEIGKIDTILNDTYNVGKTDGNLDFSTASKFLPKEATIIERAYNLVKNFKGPMTPKSIDSLAATIERMKGDSTIVNEPLHKIINSLRNSVAKMGEEAGYQEGADVSKNYAIAMDKIDNFTSLFKASTEDLRSKEGQQIPLTEIEKTKIVNDLQTLFSGNKDIDKDVLRSIFGGQKVLSREAGRTMATASEKASTKIGDFIREMIISPILSPKRIGQIAAYTGIAKEKVPAITEAIKKIDPELRGVIIEHLSRE